MHRWRGAGGLWIAGDAWGDPRHPLVILLHGGGQTRHAWKGTGRALGAAGYHAVAFDARGHGDSEWANDGMYSQDVTVQDLRCVVQALGDGPCILVGASMGGGTSLVAAAERSVGARALVLVDIAPRIETKGIEHIRAFMRRNPDGFASLEEVADAIASYQPHRARPANLLGLAKNVRQRANGRLYWHWDPRFLLGHRDLVRRQQRLEECARALTIPTLLVRGAHSDVLSDEGVAQFKALAPHSEFVSIASAGHMVAGDRNDAFGDAVLEFLGRTLPSGARAGDRLQPAQGHRVRQYPDLEDIP
ncbi:alpha/beta hydrolase [Ramlibacter henchirensis]